MRIAVVAPPWVAVPPTGYGGTELVLDTLCRGLSGAGHDVLLCTTADSTCPVERSWIYERPVGVANISPAAEAHHVMHSYDAARAWGADVVHDHTVTGIFWAQLHSHCPVVTTNHGPFAGELLAVYRRTSSSVPVIAISRDQAGAAKGVEVAAVIHHGLDTDAIAPGSGAGDYALFLGRMHPDKGVHRAIEVARRAGVPLRIAAKLQEPAERQYFEAAVAPLLGGGVEYLGEVGGDEKQRLLRDAICLLNPIAWPEPFGMVMIEALAAGTPVVATPRGAAPEIVDDGVTGFLREDDDGLVEALGRVGSLHRGACRRAAVERFSMRRMTRDHLAVYAELLDAERREAAALERMLDSEAGAAARLVSAG